MAKQKPIPQQQRAGLSPMATPVSRMITPAENAPQGPMPEGGPAPRPVGPTAQQQYADALNRYGNQLTQFSPSLAAMQQLRKGMYDLGNPIVENNIKSQQDNARLLVEKSQKSFSELVASGEISKHDNPWFLSEAKLASGRMQARRYVAGLSNSYDSYWEANKQELDEQAFPVWHEQHKSGWVQSARISDPDELAAFHQAVSPYIMQQESVHLKRVQKYRSDQIDLDLSMGVEELGVNYSSELNRIENEGPREPVLDPIRRFAANSNAKANALAATEKMVQGAARHMGLTEANRTVAKLIVGQMTNANTYSPIYKYILDNLPTTDGATLGDTAYVKSLLRNNDTEIRVASSSLTDNQKLDWVEFVTKNGRMSSEDMMAHFENNFSDDPVLVAQTNAQLPQMRSVYNAHLGKVSPERQAILNEQMNKRRVEGTVPSTIEEFHEMPEFRELLDSATGDQALINELRSPGYYDKMRRDYFDRGIGLEADNLYKVFDYVQTHLKEKRPALSQAEVHSFISEELGIPKSHPDYIPTLKQIQSQGLMSPPEEGFTAEGQIEINDWVQGSRASGREPSPTEVLTKTQETMPDATEAQKYSSLQRALASVNGPTKAEVKKQIEAGIVGQLDKVINENPNLVLTQLHTEMLAVGNGQRQFRDNIATTDNKHDVIFTMPGGEELVIDVRGVYETRKLETAEAEVKEYKKTLNEYIEASNPETGNEADAKKIRERNGWVVNGPQGLLTKAMQTAEKHQTVPSLLRGAANQGVELAGQLDKYDPNSVAEVAELMDSGRSDEIKEEHRSIWKTLSGLQETYTVWKMTETNDSLRSLVFDDSSHPLMETADFLNVNNVSGGEQVSQQLSARMMYEASNSRFYPASTAPNWTITTENVTSDDSRDYKIEAGSNWGIVAQEVERYAKTLHGSHRNREARKKIKSYVDKNWVNEGGVWLRKSQAQAIMIWTPDKQNLFRHIHPNADAYIAKAAQGTTTQQMERFNKFVELPGSNTRKLMGSAGVDFPEGSIKLIPQDSSGAPTRFNVEIDRYFHKTLDANAVLKAIASDMYRSNGGEYEVKREKFQFPGRKPPTEREQAVNQAISDGLGAVWNGVKWVGSGVADFVWNTGVMISELGPIQNVGEYFESQKEYEAQKAIEEYKKLPDWVKEPYVPYSTLEEMERTPTDSVAGGE